MQREASVGQLGGAQSLFASDWQATRRKLVDQAMFGAVVLCAGLGVAVLAVILIDVFMKGAPATGKVFHISETGRIVKIIDNLQYANGVAYDARGRRLLVSEHLARKVWQYKLGSDSSVIDSSVFLDIDKHFSPAEMDFRETGPDGIEIDHEGNTYIPVYGAGHVMVVMAGGETKKLPVDCAIIGIVDNVQLGVKSVYKSHS